MTIDALPSWLRDDGQAAASARADSQLLQGAFNTHRQQQMQSDNIAHDNWIQDAQLALQKDTHQTQQEMAGIQIQTAQAALDQQKLFASDTPALLEYGRKIHNTKTFEEMDAVPVPDVKSFQGVKVLQDGQIFQQGQISALKLRGYAANVKQKTEEWLFNHPGQEPTEQELLDLKKGAAAEVAPAESIKQNAIDQRGLDAEDRANLGITARTLSAGLGGVRGVQAKQAVENEVKSLKSIGVEVPQGEVDQFTAGATSGGVQSVNASPGVVKNLEAENKSFQQLNEVTDRIAKYNEKYGPHAFEDVVGPFDSALVKFKSKNTTGLPEKDRQAVDIFRDAAFVVQAYRNGQFGTALTEGESQKFKEIVADPSFNDYERALKSFRNSVGKSVRIVVDDHKLATNIALPIKKRFLVDYTPDGNGGLVPTAAESRIQVQAPDGTVGDIPDSKLQQALSKGYKKL